jgi:2-polyprenyl-3-methyl-5-hydroxy-6-metoxy-1,4-benzoquinol methylase
MIIWNRLKYVLSPQFDIYEKVGGIVRGRVADIGFGTGFGTHLLTVNAKEVYAYEIDEYAIRFAQAVFPIPRIHFLFGDIQKGIEIKEQFDFVTMIDVIEHLGQVKQALANMKAILASGGNLIVSTPNRLSRYRKSENHITEYGPKDLETILKQTFANVSLRNHALEPLASKYENPLLAFCRNE